MSRWIYDIESDGLHKTVSRMWILAAYNLDEKKMYYWLEGDMGWVDVFNNATLVVGHNIIDYDNYVLKKLFGFTFPKTCTIHDTLVMSKVLNYRRFGDAGHGLAQWGAHLNYPKGDFHDFSQYSEEMKAYCLQDVRLTAQVYGQLRAEFLEAIERNSLIRDYMRVEHAVARWCAMCYEHGWPFDTEKGLQLEEILLAEKASITEKLEARLGFKAVAKDKKAGEAISKYPKWVKNGFYDVHTANWFGVDVCSGFEGEERPLAGEYCRLTIEPLKLSSNADVKTFLFRNGWVPTEFNFKWDPELGRKVETSPKISEDSLEFLGGDGKLYKEYLTAVSRHGILKGFLENTDENGRVHGQCRTIGTPSMRATHSIIVNIPSGDARYGREMRELFKSIPGWTLVGCDSAGNQARGLAHFLGNEEYTDILLNGDIHMYNADKADAVLANMNVDWSSWLIENNKIPEDDPDSWEGHKTKKAWLQSGSPNALKAIAKAKRGRAKRILYAFLFGASGKKLWSYIFDVQDHQKGTRFKTGFTKAVPGFQNLMKRLDSIYSSTSKRGEGYIPSLAGTRVYVDSFHKLLVYLLQSTEKITCGAAIMLLMERLEAEGIPFIPCIFMHDEADFLVPDAFAQRAGEIGRQCFKDGPAMFGVDIMDGGDPKLGANWYEIH